VLRVDYLSIQGLRPLSFAVQAGECLAIVGPSGSGKTRLLRAIADLDPAEGHVFVEGVERREVTGPHWRKQVRYASAEPAWWAPTVRQHLAPIEKLDRLVSGLGLALDRLDAPIAELSTGERQRFGLLRAIADEPRALLLDEPTSALDAQTTALVEELIKFQGLAGRMLILVSHDAAQIARLAHHTLLLGGPEVVRSGATASAEFALKVGTA
jgi:ABC-type multidrug transport system ATPase subunit